MNTIIHLDPIQPSRAQGRTRSEAATAALAAASRHRGPPRAASTLQPCSEGSVQVPLSSLVRFSTCAAVICKRRMKREKWGGLGPEVDSVFEAVCPSAGWINEAGDRLATEAEPPIPSACALDCPGSRHHTSTQAVTLSDSNSLHHMYQQKKSCLSTSLCCHLSCKVRCLHEGDGGEPAYVSASSGSFGL